jgi:hypothetical protein
LKRFPAHKPKQLEFIQQKHTKDCGVACAAMLSDKLYEEIEVMFHILDKSTRSIYPDDIFEVLEEIGYDYDESEKLPKKGRALVAVEWKSEGLAGHYVVWDSKRKQFLDPLHGVMGQREMLKYASIDYIWRIIRRDR